MAEKKTNIKSQALNLIESQSLAELLQESRIFNEKNYDPNKCKALLSKQIFVINRGSRLNDKQSQDLFFAITRQFQAQQLGLKKMIYIMIKELVDEPSFFIVTNSIQNDIKSKNHFISENAIRVMPNVLDQIKLQAEEILKKAFNDKELKIANSALLAAFAICRNSPDILKKLSNEILNLLNSKKGNSHYHAINTLYYIKKMDMMSFVKILVNIAKGSQNFNTLTKIQILRFMGSIYESDLIDNNVRSQLFYWITRRHSDSNYTVTVECAKVLVNMKNIKNTVQTEVVTNLGYLIHSTSSVNTYSALRIFHKLIQNPSRAFQLANTTSDIEQMTTHQNKEIRCQAVCIQIKSAKEEKIGSLLNKTFEIFLEIPDRTKIEIIESCISLATNFPNKTMTIQKFLWKCLRDRGELLFKDKTIDVMYEIMQGNRTTFDYVLDQFSEYIEDPDWPELVLKILNIFIEELENSKKPQKYIRYVLNRIHLDGPTVRSAGISCLGELGLKIPKLKHEIQSVLDCFKNDLDDEVRERSCFYLNLHGYNEVSTKQKVSTISQNEVLQIENHIKSQLEDLENLDIDAMLGFSINKDLVINTNSNNKNVQNQTNTNQGMADLAQNTDIAQNKNAPVNENLNTLRNFFRNHETFVEYDELRTTSEAKNLIENEAEYFTTVKKHMFDDYIVLEFSVTNNSDEHDISDVQITIDFENDDLQVAEEFTNQYIKQGSTGSVYISIARNPEADNQIMLQKFNCTQKFRAIIKDSDGSVVNEYEDDYALDEFELITSDYLTPKVIGDGKFQTAWNEISEEEKKSNFVTEYNTVEVAINAQKKHFNIFLCDNSDVLVPNRNFHVMYLSGQYLGETEVLIQFQIGIDPSKGCVYSARVKTEDPDLTTGLLESLNNV